MPAFGCGSVPVGNSPAVHKCWKRHRSRPAPWRLGQLNLYSCSARQISVSMEQSKWEKGKHQGDALWKLCTFTSFWPHRQPDRCRRKGQYSACWVNSPCRRLWHPLSVWSVWHSLLFLNIGLFFWVWDGSSAPVKRYKGYNKDEQTEKRHQCVFF